MVESMIPGGPGFLGEDGMDTKLNRKTWKSEKGQSLVEFALVVPMLLLLVFGIAEFGRAWMVKNILTGAAREASRVAVVRDGGYDKSMSRANNILASANIFGATVKVDIPDTDFSPVTTTISYQLVAITPLMRIISSGSSGEITLTSSASMRKEY
jgi:Flp pilus assembly protein TadG